MGSHSGAPVPFGFVRTMGYVMRCGSYNSCKLEMPFAQMGSAGYLSRASTRTTLPSFTDAAMPHFGTWLHMSQYVYFTSSGASSAMAPSG